MVIKQRVDKEIMKQLPTQWRNAQPLKNDIMKFVDKWIELEKFNLSEVTRNLNDKRGIYSLVSGCYV